MTEIRKIAFMPFKSSIPSFSSFQVPDHSAKWIESDQWDLELFTYDLKKRSSFCAQIFRPPKVLRSHSEMRYFISGTAILMLNGEVGGWMEMHSIQHYFRSTMIFVDIEPNVLANSKLIETSLGSLVTVSFFNHSYDFIRLLPLSHRLTQIIKTFECWGREFEVQSPVQGLTRTKNQYLSKPFISYVGREIDRNDWLNEKMNQPYKQKFLYLAKKNARLESSKNMTKKSNKRSLLARLIRPKIDDSLF